MAKKKASKKVAKKATSRSAATADKFSVIDEVHQQFLETAEISRTGEIRIKRTDVKNILEDVFQKAAAAATSGEKVKLPFLGNLMYSIIKARKAGKGTNPFTGEPMVIKARPESRKPRFSFARACKEVFANKRNWK